jgi:oxamate amidohydrolase
MGADVGGPGLALEGRFAPEVVDALRARGHDVQVLEPYTSAVGHAHMIRVLENGVYVGAADPRADSLALGF